MSDNTIIVEGVSMGYTYDTQCLSCGKKIELWFNGGELDESMCCGIKYALEIGRIDLIIHRPSGDKEI